MPRGIARQQKARSFKLQAPLSLAKLYRSTARPLDAYAILAPALEGFSPTPESPEMEQAQALLAGLADTDEGQDAEGLSSMEQRFPRAIGYSGASRHTCKLSLPAVSSL
jgi:hypothetical protein